MLPIRNEDGGKGLPFVTITLILLCTAAYITSDRLTFMRGLVPLDLVYALLHPSHGLSASLLTIIAAFFLHGSLIHLLSNMWFLWIFGSCAERCLGIKTYFAVYFACGIVSMLVHVASSPFSKVPVIGASGAIAGIMGLNLIYKPLSKILVLVPPVFLFRVPAIIFLLLWFLIQYFNLVHQPSAPVAWWAHIGGYCAGVMFGIYLRIRNTGKRERK